MSLFLFCSLLHQMSNCQKSIPQETTPTTCARCAKTNARILEITQVIVEPSNAWTMMLVWWRLSSIPLFRRMLQRGKLQTIDTCAKMELVEVRVQFSKQANIEPRGTGSTVSGWFTWWPTADCGACGLWVRYWKHAICNLWLHRTIIS